MLRRALTGLFVSAPLILSPSATMALNLNRFSLSCSMLSNVQGGLQSLRDGQLYYSPQPNVWAPTSIAPTDFKSLPPKHYAFTYVVRDFSASGRAGVVVIKSGGFQSSDGPPARADSVLMIRRGKTFSTPKNCPASAPKYFAHKGELVSAASYDGYHDYGYQGAAADMDSITRFHVIYETSGGACLATDRPISDKTFPGFWRSNRSQFSFNDGIVDDGMGWQIADAARNLVGQSHAAYRKFTERQVESRRYQTAGQQAACITFSLRGGPDRFLSINDLENWTNGIRGPELRWNHMN
jgi:hypothetical protein